MKRILFASLAVVALASGTAFAADLPAPVPVFKAPPPPPPTWTGCFIAGGGGWGVWNQDITGTTAGVTSTAKFTTGGNGWFGTAQAGCDYQFDRVVIGAFGDYDLDGLNSTISFPTGAAANEFEHWSWSAGARIGWLAFPKLLTYASGGYTQAQFGQLSYFSAATGAPFATTTPANTYTGWFIGTGYEYALDSLPFGLPLPAGLFWKTEFRYSSYGTASLPVLGPAGVPSTFGINSDKQIETIRSELVWRFNWSGPGVFRY
jgi:outer membrane immunogenic protein